MTATNNGKTRQINLLLLPNFTLLSLGSVIDPMRMANQLAGQELYDWCIVTEKGEPVTSSDGVQVMGDTSMAKAPPCEMLLVMGGWGIAESFTDGHLQFLRKLDGKGVKLGAACTGTYVLAEAGLMDHHPCSIHWETLTALQERHPLALCSNRLFTVTDTRVTSSGGTAPLDMMINLIRQDYGAALGNAISEMFVLDRIRSDTEFQKVPLKLTTGKAPAKLIEATNLMEANIEEPLALEQIASMLEISRRQLERLFKGNLDCPPSRYYMRVRLQRARQLLKQTTLSIIDIALQCGFVSTPHFSKCYRAYLGLSPRQERAEQKPGQQTEAHKPPRLVATEPSFAKIHL